MMTICTCNFGAMSVLLDDMPDDTNPHGGSCPLAPKTQQITAALDAALPYAVGFHNTGGGCHAIRVEVGDYQRDDFREVMITDVDVFTVRDWETDEHLCGEFWIGAYDGSGDPLGEESLIVVADGDDFAVVLPKIVDAVRTQLTKVEALPKPNPDAMSEDGSGLRADVEPEVPTRQYVVGLPVVVGIRDDGFVIVDVDTAELASSLGEHSDIDAEQIAADAAVVRTWAQQHAIASEGYVR